MKSGWILAAALGLAGCGGEDPTSEPPADAGPPDANRGAAIYAANCAGCHGDDGQGSSAFPSAPSLAAAGIQGQSDDDLASTIRDGEGGMPAFAGSLTEAQIRDVVAHLRTLGR